jgi:long-chain acyl-CoA synthetase
VVPALLPALLQTGVRAERVPTLRQVLVSSAPLAAELARRFAEDTGISLVQGWGLSEYTNFACCLALGAPVVDGELTCVGGALPGTEVRVDPSGELCVRGPSRMLGYLGDPEATAAAIDDAGWLHTGDQGMFRGRAGRSMFYVTGRIKEIIIRAGDKLSPLAIERRIFAAAPELDGRLVVLGFVHQMHGEEVGAYLEAESLDDRTRARLAGALETLPPDQRPKVVLWGREPIPRTHTGKIQRRKLQPLFAPFVDARGPTRVECAA